MAEAAGAFLAGAGFLSSGFAAGAPFFGASALGAMIFCGAGFAAGFVGVGEFLDFVGMRSLKLEERGRYVSQNKEECKANLRKNTRSVGWRRELVYFPTRTKLDHSRAM